MALTQAQKNQCIRDLAALANAAGTPFNFSRSDITAAVDAVDAWATANAAAYNSALPAVFRNAATAAQKAMILAYVCERRAGV